MKSASEWASQLDGAADFQGPLTALLVAAQADAMNHCLATISATMPYPHRAFEQLHRQRNLLLGTRQTPVPGNSCPTCTPHEKH